MLRDGTIVLPSSWGLMLGVVLCFPLLLGAWETAKHNTWVLLSSGFEAVGAKKVRNKESRGDS